MLVLDSDVLIDLLRKEPQTTQFLETLHRAGETIATTSINVAEVLRGVQDRVQARDEAARMIGLLVEIPVGPRAARRFGHIMNALDRAGSPIPVLDGLIAAATLEEAARVVTRNTRHFDRVAGLGILRPEPHGPADAGSTRQ